MTTKAATIRLRREDAAKIIEFLSRVVPRGPKDQDELEAVLRALHGMI